MLTTRHTASWQLRVRSSLFTLIELLVVISIIAILAALLMPALHKSLKTAKASVCLNNEKQIGIASAIYANDYSGWIPGAQVYGNKPGGTMPWSVLYTDIYRYGNPFAGVYLQDTSLLFCPSGYIPPTGYSWQGVCTTWNTYGLVVSGSSGSWAGLSWNSWTKVKDLGGYRYERWYSPSKCLRPSALAVLADTVQNDAGKKQASEWQPKSVYSNIRVQLRHGTAANFLFLDGHAGAMTAADFPTKLDITKLCSEDYINLDY